MTRAAAIAVGAAVAACSGHSTGAKDGGQQTDGGGPTVTASVRLNPDDPVGALVHLTTTDAVSGQVVYGDVTIELGYAYSTPTFAIPASGLITVPIVGLTPGGMSHARATAFDADGGSAPSSDVRFMVPELPDGIPTFDVTTRNNGTDFVLLGIATPDGGTHATMIDRTGRIIWDRVGPASARGEGFTRSANGDFVMYRGDTQEFDEVDLGTQPVREWTDQSAPLGADGHRILFDAEGGALLAGWGSHEESSEMVYDVHVDAFDASGTSTFSWDSSPDFSLADMLPRFDGQTPPIDDLHPVSVDVDASGNPVIALENAGCVAKIDRATGAVMWRFGGVHNSFSITGDGGITLPLDARVLANGNLLVLDSTPSFARVVEYSLDETAMMATFVSQFRHTPDLMAAGGGSAVGVADGAILIAWGGDGIVTQINESGTVVWEAQTTGSIRSAELTQAINP